MTILHGATKGGCILYKILVSKEKTKELCKLGYFEKPHAFYETNLGRRVLRRLTDQEKKSFTIF